MSLEFLDLRDTDGRQSSLSLSSKTGLLRVLGELPHGTEFDPAEPCNAKTFQRLAELAAEVNS